MDVQVEQTSELIRTITVTIPASEVSADIDKDLEKIRKTHRRRGFRPGKVPMNLIRGQFGPSVKAQVADRLLRSTLNDVIARQQGVVHITNPEVLTSDFVTSGLQYRFRAEALPVVEPVNYVEVEVGRPPVAIDEANIEAELTRIQQENAFNQPVDKAVVEDGDLVEVHYRYISLGAETQGEDARWHDSTFEVGSESMMAGFHEAVRGAAPGDTRTFSMDLPTDGGDVPATVEVEVKAILEKITPALDDELAKDDGRAETLDALRDVIRADLSADKAKKADQIAEDKLIHALLEANPFELPPGYFEAQLDNEVKGRMRSIFGVDDPSRFGLDLGRLKDQWRDGVRDGIRRVLLLEAIAEKENIEADAADVEAKIEEIAEAQRSASATAQVRRHYLKPENRAMLAREVQIEATQKWLMDKAKLVEIEWPKEEEPAVAEQEEHDHAEGHDHDHSHDHSHDHGHSHDHDAEG